MRFGDVVECATTQYPTYAVWRDAELLITYAGLSTSCRLKDDCDRSTPGHDCCVSVWLLSVSAPSLWKAILSQPTPIEGSHGQPHTLTKFCLQASTTRTLAIPDNPTVVTVVFAFDCACSSPLLHATHLVEVACWSHRHSHREQLLTCTGKVSLCGIMPRRRTLSRPPELFRLHRCLRTAL